MSYFYLTVAIFVEIVATSSLKASNGFTNLRVTILSLFSYAISFYSLSIALRVIPVGIAYAIWSAIGTVGICVIGWVVYNQKLSYISIVGILCIIIGVVILNLGQNTH